MPEHTWLLLVKKLTKEASAAELRELEQWFLEHPDDKRMAEELSAYWQTRKPDHPGSNQLLVRHLARLKATNPAFGISPQEAEMAGPPLVSPSFLRRNLRVILSTAALLILVLSAAIMALNRGFFQHNLTQNNKPVLNEIQTRPGSRSKVVLPDGSEVWVNANSRLLYKPDFGKTHRKVQLNGEAYFNVSKNKELPFEIETRRIKVTVTGTVFNVRAYDDEEKAETSLFEGSVQVSQLTVPEKKYFLRPNQKLIIDESIQTGPATLLPGAVSRKAPVSPDTEINPEPILTTISYDPRDSMALETSWLYSTLAFNDESFLEISRKMEKWYGVEMIFESKKLEKVRFTGRFTNETILEALEALQFTATFRFKKEENRIIIF